MVYVFLAEGFEEIEALTVVDVARRAGIVTAMVSIRGKESPEPLRVTGAHGIPVTADMRIDEADFEGLDMIVLPGGLPGTTNLEACEALTARVRAFDAAGKWIGAICAAPGILGRMGLLEGREAVSYPSVEESLKGAEIPRTEVAVSGHILTSRGMGTALPFSLAIVSVLLGQDEADALAKGIIYEVYR